MVARTRLNVTFYVQCVSCYKMNGNEMYVISNKHLIRLKYCFSILSLVYKEKRYKIFLPSKASACKVLQRAAGLAGLYSAQRE
jgi:hypothetical protein